MACCDRPTYIKRIEKITKKEAPPLPSAVQPPPLLAQPAAPSQNSQQGGLRVAAPMISYHNMTHFVTQAETPVLGAPGDPTISPAPSPSAPTEGTVREPTQSTACATSFIVPQSPLTPDGCREVIDFNQIQYLQGLYQTQIGRFVRVEHLMGTTVIQTVIGFLVGVGINYVIIQAVDTPNITIIDTYSIKSVKVYYETIDFA